MDKKQRKSQQNKHRKQQKSGRHEVLNGAVKTNASDKGEDGGGGGGGSSGGAANDNSPLLFIKGNKLSPQVRKNLDKLADELLTVTHKEVMNSKDEWNQYVQIQNILQKIQSLEAPLKLKLKRASNRANRLANIDKFYIWAKQNDIQFDGIAIKDFKGYDLGLVATKDIKKDDLLFSIPHRLIMSEESVENVRTTFKTNLQLAFSLMLEFLKPNSFWKPYIDLLPDTYNTVLYYNIDQMAQLRGSNCFSGALKHCRLIAKCYTYIYHWPGKESIFEHFADIFHYEIYR